MEGGAAGVVSGGSAIEGTGAGDDGWRNGGASWRRGEVPDRRAEGAAPGVGRVGEARMDGAGVEEASQNGRTQGEDGGAIETRDGHDVGLDCAALADGLPTYSGKLFKGLFLQ